MIHEIDAGEDDSDSRDNVPTNTPPVPTRRSSPWSLPIAGGIVLVVLAIAMAFLLNVVPGQSTPSRRAANTATPIPRVFYTADWSHGTDGWTLPSHWHLVKGRIENDGYGTGLLLIPYRVTVPNYTVAVDFTVEKITNYPSSHSYGIGGYTNGNTIQFMSSISSIMKLPQVPAYHAFSQNYVAHADSQNDQMSTQDYTVQFYTQTFTVQVQDKDLAFCMGVDCLADVYSATPLWPLQIGIYDDGVQLSISRIVITSP
jgi:hypothetical protein